MDPEIAAQLAEQDKKLDAIYRSVEKMRRYALWSTIGQILIFLLPLIGLTFAIPWLLNTLGNTYSGLL